MLNARSSLLSAVKDISEKNKWFILVNVIRALLGLQCLVHLGIAEGRKIIIVSRIKGNYFSRP